MDNISDSFRLFCSQQIVALIVTATNVRAKEVHDQWNQQHPDKQKKRRSTTADELYAFFGLCLLAGVFRGRREPISSLWTGTASYQRPVFPATMNRERMKQLKSFLRFDDEATRIERRATDKLAAIRDVFDEFDRNCTIAMNVGPDLTIDEHMIAFRGNCPFRQYIPTKPGKYGKKVWVLADNRNYYANKLQVYTGASLDGTREVGQGARVVRDLTAHPKKGYGVTMDNFFTDVALAEELLSRDITVVGTMRANKRDIPDIMKANREREVKSSVFLFDGHITMVSYVPKKNKAVVLISSQHHDKAVGTEEQQLKPEIILHYNQTKSSFGIYSNRNNAAMINDA